MRDERVRCGQDRRAFAIKFLSAVLCLAIMLGTAICFRTAVGAASGPLLYYNDRAWLKSRLPLEKVYEVYYVPISYLAKLTPDVDVQINKGMKMFLIQCGENFLTFETESDFAYNQDRAKIYIKTYLLHDEYYVPVKTVCEYLGIGYESITSSSTGETAIRITNGEQKLTMRELVERKYPAFFETSAETPSTIQTGTTADTTDKVTTPVTSEPERVLSHRTIYLTIEDSPSEHTGELLDILSEYGYSVTFFVIGERAIEDPAALARIVSEGHEIALHTMNHDPSGLVDADSILEDIRQENELLYGLIRRKSHIWRAPEGSSGLASLDRTAEITINQNGYVVWDYNIDAGTAKTAGKAVEMIIDGIWNTEIPVIRIHDNADAAEILKGVLSFIKENADACEVRTILPAYYEFNQIS